MRTFKYVDLDGEEKEHRQLGENSALSFIEKRIEYWMPKETIEADKLKATVASIDVDVQRNITPEEANQMVKTIKDFIISEIDGAEKFYVSKERKNS